MEAEIILVTGGSGFLGQHIVRELQHNDTKVTEIRVLDLNPYLNKLGHANTKPIISYIGDITNVNSIEEAFKGVSCVIHCASLVSYAYPPKKAQLQSVNVEGTKNIITLCKKFDVPRLVFTSTTEITLVPYFRWWVFSAIVNQTETKAVPPTDGSKLIFHYYAASKLEAERLVLEANNLQLKSGGRLRTVALRPTILYGEEDTGFIVSLIKMADMFDGNLIRIGGTGGKQQICYAGNAAWAHIAAKNILYNKTNTIQGMPVFITDDSQVIDTLKFCERTVKNTDGSKRYRSPWWYIPIIFSYYLALILEFIMDKLHPWFIKETLPISMTTVVAYLSSIVMYNRLRASIHLHYSPIYKLEVAQKRSCKFYSEINSTSDNYRIQSYQYLSKDYKYVKLSMNNLDT